ncbi:hypothetical protein LTR28_008307, partial [Elasticomyces elasticus]
MQTLTMVKRVRNRNQSLLASGTATLLMAPITMPKTQISRSVIARAMRRALHRAQMRLRSWRASKAKRLSNWRIRLPCPMARRPTGRRGDGKT